jgi:hypothetical protein
MEVLGWQVLIFISILIAGAVGRRTLSAGILFWSIWTVFQLFMFWLSVLQFATILLAWLVCENVNRKNLRKNLVVVFAILGLLIYFLYQDVQKQKEEQRQVQKTVRQQAIKEAAEVAKKQAEHERSAWADCVQQTGIRQGGGWYNSVQELIEDRQKCMVERQAKSYGLEKLKDL